MSYVLIDNKDDDVLYGNVSVGGGLGEGRGGFCCWLNQSMRFCWREVCYKCNFERSIAIIALCELYIWVKPYHIIVIDIVLMVTQWCVCVVLTTLFVDTN